MRSHAYTTVPLLTSLWGLGGVAPLCTPVRPTNASESTRNDLSRGPEDLRARCKRFGSLKISKTKNRNFSHFWTKCEGCGELFRPNFTKMICTIFSKNTVALEIDRVLRYFTRFWSILRDLGPAVDDPADPRDPGGAKNAKNDPLKSSVLSYLAQAELYIALYSFTYQNFRYIKVYKDM